MGHQAWCLGYSLLLLLLLLLQFQANLAIVLNSIGVALIVRVIHRRVNDAHAEWLLDLYLTIIDLKAFLAAILARKTQGSLLCVPVLN